MKNTRTDQESQPQNQPEFGLLDFAMNKVHEAAFLIDEHGHFQYVNENACHVLGYGREELLKLGVPDIDPDYPTARWEDHWIDLQQQGSLLFEGRHKTKTGVIFPVEINANYFEYSGSAYNLALVRDITDRKVAEKLVFEGQKAFRTLVENSPDIIARYDSNCQRIYVNPVYKSVAKLPSGKLIGTMPNQYSPLPKESAAVLQELISRVMKTGVAEAVDIPWQKADQIVYWYNVYAVPEFDQHGMVMSVMTTSRDITKLKISEHEVLKLNRIYAVLININQIIVRLHDAHAIYQETCRIAVEFGKFRMAWIGLINERTNKVDVAASCGFTGDYPGKANIDLNDESRCSGPTGQAVKTGKYKVSNNVCADESMAPWLEDARKYGYKSVASFPLIVFDRIIGALTTYESEINFFQEEDITLLNELAKDISFALEFIETEDKRRSAEEALRDSEERYRLIAENTADTISVLDMTLKFTYVSPSVLKLLGYTAGETMRLTLKQIFTPSSYQKVTRLFAEQIALEAGGNADLARTETVELEEKCKDGSTIWVETTLSFIRDKKHIPTHILTVTRDFTQRKKAEDELRDSQERYREIFENTSDVIVVGEVNPKGQFKLIDCNPALEKITGLNRSFLAGQFLEQFSGVEPVNKILSQYHLCLETRTPANFELEMTTLTGKWYMYSTLIPVYNSAGDIYRMVGVARDITEQKLAEEGLQEYKQATEQSPVTIVITDIEGNIEYVNPKFTEISGYSYREVIGKNPRILQSGEMSKDNYREMWDTILSGVEWRGEFHNKRKDGTLFWESASISSIKDGQGKIGHFIAVKEDITERRRMEIDLLEAKEKAEEISRLKSSLLLNMSHELRTPMNGILGFAELLQEQNLDPESLNMAKVISSSGRRLMTTLNSILDLAQVESGKLTLALIPVHLSEIIHKIETLYCEQAENKGLTFISTADDQLYSKLDERLFENILHHLLDNAIKFTATGSILLRLQEGVLEGKPAAVITIKDTGIGIRADQIDTIFEAFRQSSEGMGRSFEGTGLGLTLCRKFATLLNGVIHVESLPDIGSTFTVKFPLYHLTEEDSACKKEVEKRDETPKSSEAQSSGEKPHVLIVEDNEQNSELMELFLKGTCVTDTVHSGRQAVKHAFMNQYDCILMDINLGPDMDGMLATKEIRTLENYKETPIIAVTGFSTIEEKIKIMAGGLNQILTKPFTREQLVNIIISSVK